MPDVVLAALVLVVAPYVLLVGVTSGAFFRVRRQEEPPDPPDWPTVSVVVPVPPDAPDDLPQSLLDCSYPEDRVEIVLVHGPDESPSVPDEAGIPIRRLQLKEPLPRSTLRGASLHKVRSTLRSEVLLITTAEAEVSPSWIQSMVRRCTVDTPFVVGPTVVEHEDLFLPRLEALVRVGGSALAAGLQSLGLPIRWLTPNLAIRGEVLDGVLSETDDLFSPGSLPSNGRIILNPEPEAVLTGPSVSSFAGYVRRMARAMRAVWEASWKTQLLAVGVWLTHLCLLACCLAAVALPAWRQPTLLALLGKMGADALLLAPAARYYGQGGLTRSIVPTELLLVLTIPLAGILSYFNILSPTEVGLDDS